jgi:adenine-specific DNA-methyltransferase
MAKRAETYRHEEEALLRPEVGTQPQFRKRKAPKTYRYDSSLSPALDWDGQNHARELGEWLLAQIEEASQLEPPHRFDEPRRFGDVEVAGLADAVERLKALSRPFLDWAGKAERLSFDVPTLPLFVHERLSTKAILETLKGHERDRQMEMQLFADPQLPLHKQLEAYEHKGGWVNRLILGDSLVVMNSLLEYEGLGGQVQMIYIDPPYAVEFGSNFQPFVRSRDVKDFADESMTREPEMVRAYRDSWELGEHSYLTYLRDRFVVARDLLSASGSLFCQINDRNAYLVREVLTEIFGSEGYVVTIPFKKKGSQKGGAIEPLNDYLIWFTKDREQMVQRFMPLFVRAGIDEETLETFRYVDLPGRGDVSIAALSKETGIDYRTDPDRLYTDFPGARLFTSENLTGGGIFRTQAIPYEYAGKRFDPGIRRGNSWKHSAITDDGSPSGMDRLAAASRLFVGRNQLRFKRYLDDFGYKALSNWWDRLGGAANPIYVVQTNLEVLRRCILMTTRPGDLVLDPTCGSGTTAYVAEQWGRRWITIDTSRVPLALTRQRLLTATFPYYKLDDPGRGPATGFVYRRRQNRKGQEVGGIVPHITSSTIANDEPAKEEVLVDRPEVESKITRVTGPFVVEATIPTPVEIDGDGDGAENGLVEDTSFTDRLLEALRRNPILQLGGNRTLELRNVRPPGKTLTLSAEAMLEPDDAPVAIVFGPENGAVSEKLVYEAAREAHLRSYEQLLVIGFAIEANARSLVEKIEHQIGIPTTYVQATPDLLMGDLLKTMRSSQLFSVAGLPDVALRKLDPEEPGGPPRYEVELRGLDTFDPTTMEAQHRSGDDVPAWFLDTDWNGLSFHVSQAFFPRTSAWDNLRKALRTEFDDAVWEHLSGTVSAPFLAGESGEVAVKVLDDRGNELLVVKPLAEAE